MTHTVKYIIDNQEFDKKNIITLLLSSEEDERYLFDSSRKVMLENVSNKVYFRGLIEFSNECVKDCFYCGIRRSNTEVERYNLSDEDILSAAKFAHQERYGSVVLQSGEKNSSAFIERIENLIKEIKKLSNNELGITLSCGEQTKETYQKWFDAGAHRYLLRIESSNQSLYQQMHPQDGYHLYTQRMECLKHLKQIGYQVGTGVMIGIPFQTFEDLADDLLFMQSFDIDMCGMGPYIEHTQTPLYQHKNVLWSQEERFKLALKMIAVLRLMMKNINIAAATALQAIDLMGREKALRIGANIIMPNITPTLHRKDYKLYENKPCTDEGADDCAGCLKNRIEIAGGEIGYGQWGDSEHFKNK